MPQVSHLQWEGRRIFGSRFQRLVSEGITRALEHTLGVATALVPLNEGPLQRSGKVVVDGLNGAISYDTPYAVRQLPTRRADMAPRSRATGEVFGAADEHRAERHARTLGRELPNLVARIDWQPQQKRPRRVR